jgi:TetR/AcrR family transcriptional repressor of nem operon
MPRSTHRAETRERILDAAATCFRRRGYAATGVDAVMAEAGLTHGGFYAHFPSKADLLTATVAGCGDHPTRNPLFHSVAHLRGVELIAGVIDAYLSRWHRDHPEQGCPIPSLGPELPRIDPVLAPVIGGPLARLGDLLRANLPPPDDTSATRAQALLALLVGSIVAARALPDSDADTWLAAGRLHARRIAGLPDISHE